MIILAANVLTIFRVNSELKEAFNKVCKTNHLTLSREIKLFMNKVVKNQTTDL
jgi:antitoxin component of RelBE/YafQ-DinJ toxin-antitoxin module